MRKRADDRYVYERQGWPVEVKHLDGVPWYEAPIPRRWHHCWAQTDGWERLLQVWRCACGASAVPIKGQRVHWEDRNSRTR